MPRNYPGKSAFAGLFRCPHCNAINHFSYLFLSKVEDLTEIRKCSHCGRGSQLKQYGLIVRSFKPE